MAFRKLFTAYGNLLKKYPIPTQAAQTGEKVYNVFTGTYFLK